MKFLARPTYQNSDILTAAEIDALLAGYSQAGHGHNDLYYLKSETYARAEVDAGNAAQDSSIGTLVSAVDTLGTAIGNMSYTYVERSLYGANTILFATTAETPAALTVGASTIVGRKSTGGIVALAAADGRAVLGLGTMATEAATNYSTTGHTHASYSLTTHNHDTSYAAASHNHDGSYYTETEVNSLLAGYVAKSVYNAYSILYADTDNTPAALTVGASTIVGRKATGGIAALTAADGRTVLGLGTMATQSSSSYSLTTHTHSTISNDLTVEGRLLADTTGYDWSALTPVNNWTNFGSPNTVLGVKRFGTLVSVKGVVKATANIAANTPVVQLAAAYYPSAGRSFVCIGVISGAKAVTRVYVDTNGYVRPQDGFYTNDWLSLEFSYFTGG